MIPRFHERLKVGSNIVEELNVSVSASATTLFARHVEAVLREFANWSATSWGDEEDEYWTIFTCNADATGRYVSIFVGWMMRQNVAIDKIWIAVGGEGPLWNCDLCRPAMEGEAIDLLSRLRAVVKDATQKAHEGVLYPLDVATRIDAAQPVLPLRPLSLGQSLLVTIPRDPDADKLGWGHNAGLALLIKVLAADQKDAEQAAGKHVFEFLLFWTLISGSYCHSTKLIFSGKNNQQEAAARVIEMSLSEAAVDRLHWYSRVHSKTALGLAEPLWGRLQALSSKTKTKIRSSLAAYRSGLGAQRGLSGLAPSLAVVAYVAALESLVFQPSKCEGKLRCELCGPLSLKHEKASHIQTILQAVFPTVREELRPDVEKSLKHAYRELRSAYVHSAQTEWREFAGEPYLWEDITDSEEFWRKKRPFWTLFRIDEIVRDFIIFRIGDANNTTD